MNDKTIKENNEKIMAQAEENAKAVLEGEEIEEIEETEEISEESNEVMTLASTEDKTGVNPTVSADIEEYNYFIGNESVSPVNGSLTYKKTLFTLKGRNGFDLPITISYNSESSHRGYYEGFFPYKIAEGWHFCFDGVAKFYNLYFQSSWNKMFKFAEGSSYLIDSSSDNLTEKQKSRYQKKDVEITATQVKYLNGVTETFNSEHGGIETMTDRFGNGYQFTYTNDRKLLKIQSLADENDCVNFTWTSATETEPKKLTVSYKEHSVIFTFRQESTTWLVDLVTSITDIDGLTTSFDYDIQEASYINEKWEGSTPNLIKMDYGINAYYHLINKVTYPTGGCRKYTYTTAQSESFPSFTRHFVQTAELCESDTVDAAVVETVTYTYQLHWRNIPADFMTDFDGNVICAVDSSDSDNDHVRTAVIDNGKTVTKYAFSEKGVKLGEEVYKRGYSSPHSKTIYTIDETNDLPTNIKTGIFKGNNWSITEESCEYIPYYDFVTQKTDKMGRTTVYEYFLDETGEKVINYGILKKETYENVVKENIVLQTENRRINQSVVSYKDAQNNEVKSVTTTYTYDDENSAPFNVLTETTVVTENNSSQQISKINYTYTSDKKFVETKKIVDVNANLSNISYPDVSLNPSDTSYSYTWLETRYTYDIFGRVVTERDPQYNVTSYSYTPSGKLKKKITADGSIYEYTYPNSTVGNVYIVKATYAGITEPLIKEYPCDTFGRILSEKNRINGVDNTENSYYTVNSYEYTGSNITKVTSGFGSYTTYTYDAFDRVELLKVYNQAGTLQHTNNIFYDDFNRTKRVSSVGVEIINPGTAEEITRAVSISETEYFDTLGRKIKSEKGYLGNIVTTTTYTYDNFDRVTSTNVADQTKTLTTTNVYSLDGNLLSVTDPMGNTTEYTYNAWNKIATVKYPNNAVYTYSYDTIGRLTKETDPNNKIAITLCDRNSNPSTKIDKMGHVFYNFYDCMNRVAYDLDSDSNIIARYTYVGTGALKTITDASGTTTYNYDVNGRLLSKVTPFGTMSYTYYDNGLVKMIRDYNGARITHYYDDFGRLWKITRTTYGENASTSTPVNYVYNNFGLLTLAQYSKGKTEYTYDRYNRLVEEKFYTGARNSSVAPTLVKSISYIYDNFGNIINKTITENGQQVTYHYEYDNLFRLAKYRHFFYNGTYRAYEEEAYTYDCMGNRTKLSRKQQYTFEDGLETWTVDYTYNNVNQLLTEIKTQNNETVYSYTYTYDDNGNSLTDPKTGNVMTYDYFRNKPITITGTDGTITYTYNSKGELISRSKTQNETTITNTYFWDENGYMINEGDGTSITHGNLVGLNGIFARFDGTGATYYGKNAHGDVIYTQNNLTVTKHYDYDPFGNEINPDETDTNPFRYCGEYFDVHSGTYYLRNRYYYPRLGRFTTIDPIKDGNNWYVYCGNNPLIFVDPLGLGEVMVRYIAEKNGGTVTWNEDTGTVSVTMPGFDTVEVKGRIVNGRMIVEDTWFMNTFGLSEEETTHHAGDLFATESDAVLAFALTYHDDSTEEKQEYAAAIEPVSHNRRQYFTFVNITNSETTQGKNRIFFDDPIQSHSVVPITTERTRALVHTHWDPSDTYLQWFSSADYNMFNIHPNVVSIYLVDPKWQILRSDRMGADHTNGEIIMSLR